MAYISEAKHRQLENQLFQFLQEVEKSDATKSDMDQLKRDGKLMEIMYAHYQEKVTDLLQMIRDYQVVYRRARILLRKKKLSGKQLVPQESRD